MGLFSRKNREENPKHVHRRERIKARKERLTPLPLQMLAEREQIARARKAERRQQSFLNLKKSVRRNVTRGGSFFEGVSRQRRRQLIAARDVSRPLIGRPKGSYDSRYAKYGGVYGYRKVLNAQLRVQRAQQLRNFQVTPEQETILDQVQARQNVRRLDPEQQTIPDTNGQFRLRSIHQEAEDYANLFP